MYRFLPAPGFSLCSLEVFFFFSGTLGRGIIPECYNNHMKAGDIHFYVKRWKEVEKEALEMPEPWGEIHKILDSTNNPAG